MPPSTKKAVQQQQQQPLNMWRYFGGKSSEIRCRLCDTLVVKRVDFRGTPLRLRQHLYAEHRAEYDALYAEARTTSSKTAATTAVADEIAAKMPKVEVVVPRIRNPNKRTASALDAKEDDDEEEADGGSQQHTAKRPPPSKKKKKQQEVSAHNLESIRRTMPFPRASAPIFGGFSTQTPLGFCAGYPFPSRKILV